jgi:hypothetical protein
MVSQFEFVLKGTASQAAEKVDLALAFGRRSGLPLR